MSMNSQAETALEAVLRLPPEDRLQIVEAVRSSLPSTMQPPVDEEWREILRHRLAEIQAGRTKPVEWDDVKRELDEITGG